MEVLYLKGVTVIMHLSKKIAMLAVITLIALGMFTPKAYAADAGTGEDQSLWDKLQTAGSEAANYVDEHKDGWIESAKEGASRVGEKAGELYDSAKEAAPGLIDKAKDGISDAQNQFSEWNAGQQDQFRDWFEEQTGVKSDSSSTTQQDAPVGTPPTTDNRSEGVVAPPAQEPSAPQSTLAPEPPTTSEPPAPEAPGYTFSDDGQTVVIDGEEYVKLDESDKLALKDGKARQWTFLYIGLPLLGICAIIYVVFCLRGRRR